MRKLVLSVAVLAALTLGISTVAQADHWGPPSNSHHSSCRPTPPPCSHGGYGRHSSYRGPTYGGYGYGGNGGYGGYGRSYGGYGRSYGNPYGGYGYGNPYGYGNGVSVGNGRVSFSIRF